MKTKSKKAKRTWIAAATCETTDDSSRERWANRIRNAFRLESRTPRFVEINGKSVTIGGRRTVIPPIGDPIWTQLAQRLIEEGIDGGEYVIVWFSRWHASRDLLHPRQLLDDWLISRFPHERLTYVFECEEEAMRLEREKDYALMDIGRTRWLSPGCSEKKNWLIALTSEPSLTPLFRYCQAHRLKDPEFEAIAAENEVEAGIQYLRNSAGFEQHWGGFIPADFKEQVVPRLYRQIFDEGNIPPAKPIVFDPWRH